MSTSSSIQHHYESPDLLNQILRGLQKLGRDPERLMPKDLAAVDEFHLRGWESTAETAQLAGFTAGAHLLDIGSGIGGPSRHLALALGVRVTGIDLCGPYCELANELARLTGLADSVQYHQADATRLPFEDASFDGSWTQHASMNIEDKSAFYKEMARVVRPGGRVVIYDIHGRGDQPPHFPVPWARTPDISFLCSADEIRAHLEAQGLHCEQWRDDSSVALEWFTDRMAKAAQAGPQPLGLHLILGADWPAMAGNIARNLEEGRIGVLQTVWRKP